MEQTNSRVAPQKMPTRPANNEGDQLQLSCGTKMHQSLITIREGLKNSETRIASYEELVSIDADVLSTKECILYYFIRGSYFYNKYRKAHHKSIAVLEISADYFDMMFSFARSQKHIIKNPCILYMVTSCTFQIGESHLNKRLASEYIAKAKKYVQTWLPFNNKHTGFVRLQEKLAKI